ncbi:MAG: hypothetical protein ACQETX_05455, partial [Pseudomonadota bacterium]
MAVMSSPLWANLVVTSSRDLSWFVNESAGENLALEQIHALKMPLTPIPQMEPHQGDMSARFWYKNQSVGIGMEGEGW